MPPETSDRPREGGNAASWGIDAEDKIQQPGGYTVQLSQQFMSTNLTPDSG